MTRKRLRPPREPGPEECCGSGCTRCVWDVYYDELATYNELLAERKNSGEDGVEADSGSDECEDEESSEEEEDGDNYIGSVVVKILPQGGGTTGSSVGSCVQQDLKSKYTEVKCVRLTDCSDPAMSLDQPSVNVLEIEITSPLSPTPNPGDVVEVFVPNVLGDGVDTVGSLCKRLAVEPEAVCELHRSPFVPEDNFPPWLPLRTPLTVRELLTYYVDISSCSYLLRPTFFQSLLRVHKNNSTRAAVPVPDSAKASGAYVCGTPELLAACASETDGPTIFRAMMDRGRPLCYPSLTDVLDAFPFVRLPLDRMLEISAPLRPRKFSIARVAHREQNSAGQERMTKFELCLRKVSVERDAHLRMATNIPPAAELLAKTLNQVACNRYNIGELRSPHFRGHVSFLLCELGAKSLTAGTDPAAHTSWPGQLFVSSSLFGTSTFGRELKKALTTFARTPQPASAKVFLIGAGTGIAPLMAAVHELMSVRAAGSVPTTPPPPFHVWYGAATKEELIYHNVLASARDQRAIESYKYALSRSSVGPMGEQLSSASPRYVTDLMQRSAALLKESLQDANGLVFASGPAAVLRSVRTSLESILSEPDDDESIREQRVLLLEEKNQLLFDIWSTVKSF